MDNIFLTYVLCLKSYKFIYTDYYIVLTAHISNSSPLSGWKNIASGPKSTSGYFHSTGLHVTVAGASLEAPSGKLASDS